MIKRRSRAVKKEILFEGSLSTRQLPVNIMPADLGLFEYELKKEIPATMLLHFNNVSVNPDGVLFQGFKVLQESYPSPQFTNSWVGFRVWLKFMYRNHFRFRQNKNIDRDVFWITDIWSQGYFHWMTDSLSRLFAIRDKIGNSTLLLPGEYSNYEYIVSSLKPFCLQDVKFINRKIYYL